MGRDSLGAPGQGFQKSHVRFVEHDAISDILGSEDFRAGDFRAAKGRASQKGFFRGKVFIEGSEDSWGAILGRGEAFTHLLARDGLRSRTELFHIGAPLVRGTFGCGADDRVRTTADAAYRSRPASRRFFGSCEVLVRSVQSASFLFRNSH